MTEEGKMERASKGESRVKREKGVRVVDCEMTTRGKDRVKGIERGREIKREERESQREVKRKR